MDFVGTALSTAEAVSTALGCWELTEKLLEFGFESELDDFKRTVDAIAAVLRDAEKQQELSEQAQHQIKELMNAFYEADDLMDEFVTLAGQQRLVDADGTFRDKVSIFLSRKNPIYVSYWMSWGIKDLKKKLDAIAGDNQLLINFNHNPEPVKKRRRETCSYVYVVDIIGRENDLEKIVGMLREPNIQRGRDLSFISIVGIGGLGKTAFAQLVFNDERVKKDFPLRLWTCVSDEDQTHLDIEGILRKILASATGEQNEGYNMDWVQWKLREQLTRRKFLLVLDDVWTEDREQWLDLVKYLMGGQSGSWLLVTTRSQKTAKIVGDGLMYQLQGLSRENSWRLFERMAFGSEQSNPHEDLVKIGQEIVKSCANVPLAIRVVGSLLYGQDEREWRSFQRFGVAKIKDSKKGSVMPALKLSYYQLESPLKACFRYCVLFPKDFVMEKKTLIRLWMAQGYIPVDDHRDMEEIGEEYFSILLQRCFFQDIKENDFGEIFSCKMHDLMHDVAQLVVGDICALNTITGNVDKKVRHLSLARYKSIECSYTEAYIRSYLHAIQWYDMGSISQLSVDTLVANWRYLRALDLSKFGLMSLPCSIGELLHLRYLDLLMNTSMKLLPKEITKLYNLQTLNLWNCQSLKELPKDMSKLVKLRMLDISGCTGLTYMPRGMGNLSYLHELTMFVVEEENSSGETWFKQLEDLKALRKLKGSLEIKFKFCGMLGANFKKNGGRDEGCLRDKEHLNHLELTFSREACKERVEYDKTVIEELEPHPNLKALNMSFYHGARMPSWSTFLTKLVSLTFICCPNLQRLGCLENLHHLKVLQLLNLPNLEYINESRLTGDSSSNNSGVVRLLSSKMEELSFFPSLEILKLEELPKLKGWWGRVGELGDNNHLVLLKLRSLLVIGCPEMIGRLQCPMLNDLCLLKSNKRLEITMRWIKSKKEGDEKEKLGKATTSNPKLMEVNIDNMALLKSLPTEAFQFLGSLKIEGDKEVESLGELGEVFRTCSSSLRVLYIDKCPKLRSVFGELEHLTALEELRFGRCENLRLSEGQSGDGIGIGIVIGQSLHHSLRNLEFVDLPQLVYLPNWIQYLVSLQTLYIRNCRALESLPDWMPKLTSLRNLRLEHISDRLRERCRSPTGDDWPHIQHIPFIELY